MPEDVSHRGPDGLPETVLYDVVGGVATVTMNRPEAMNALDDRLKVGLRDVLLDAADDAAVRAVVLTGSGRAFCVGQDLTEHSRNLDRFSESDPAAVWSTVTEHYAAIALTLSTMPKPVIAAVNGVAAGAGAAFALACDLRILSDTGGFNMAFTAIGLAADSGLSWTLPRLVGMTKARELLLLPETIRAAEALDLGLATRVVDPPGLLPAAHELAQRLAQGPTVAYGAIRRSLAFSAGHDLEESLDFEAQMMALTGATADHRAAVRAFAVKESATFEGR